jgi:hypothetical protein
MSDLLSSVSAYALTKNKFSNLFPGAKRVLVCILGTTKILKREKQRRPGFKKTRNKFLCVLH